MKLIATLILVGLLSGCTSWYSAKSVIATRGAKIADEELDAARWANCEAVTAGALVRRYANDPAGFKRWQEYCNLPDRGVEWR